MNKTELTILQILLLKYYGELVANPNTPQQDKDIALNLIKQINEAESKAVN